MFCSVVEAEVTVSQQAEATVVEYINLYDAQFFLILRLLWFIIISWASHTYSSSSTQYLECVNVRPCSYYATISTFLSRFSGADDGVGSVGCVHNLIEQESGLRRSRSMEILFLLSRSRFSGSGGCGGDRLSDLESTRDLSARKLQKPFGEVVQVNVQVAEEQ